MTVLFVLWGLLLVLLLGFLIRGGQRLKSSPVTYEFDWNPLLFVTGTLFPWMRTLWGNMRGVIERGLHTLFHVVFHRMKKVHDQVFGRQLVPKDGGTASFFLKTIAEHKEEHAQKYSDDRKNGF